MALIESVDQWDPDFVWSDGKPDYLKAFTHRHITYSLETLIARLYCFGSAHDFPLVCSCARCWDLFVEEESRFPTLTELKRLVREESSLALDSKIPGDKKADKGVETFYFAASPEEEMGDEGEMVVPFPILDVKYPIF